MSGIIQEVKDGKLVTDTTTTSTSKTSNDLGYEQFLQILCAEMQYQDPLEPTSNTEYIAQMATFSQLEATLSMQNTVESASANDLVGKYVIMKTTSSTTGEVSYAAGMVEYVLHQNGNTYLSVNDSLYSLDDLDTVADTDYMEAVAIAEDFKEAVSQLPATLQITLADQTTIESIAARYNTLTDYQKSFIDSDSLSSFAEKISRLNELLAAAENSIDNSNGGETIDGETADGETTGTEEPGSAGEDTAG